MDSALSNLAIELLKKLISIKSFSGNEDLTALEIQNWFSKMNIISKKENNNVYAINKYYDKNKPTLLLNSHHDTVRPNSSYTNDPFCPEINKGKLYGLGSNDAGGALVSLIMVFKHFYNTKNLKYNIIIAATAEEESSGKLGIKSLMPSLPQIDLAIVGEPTLMKIAIAEKGLVVIDGIISGTASHAAHNNNNSAIEKLPKVLDWFKKFVFEKKSKLLGPVKMTVTQINAGNQHNVIPSKVNIVVDVRVNDCYTNSEITEILKINAPCDLIPRSLDLNSSSISFDHKIVRAGTKLKMKTYGSPTLSDQSKLNCDSIKLGPGDSKRSHTANEYIYIEEIEKGIETYINLLEQIL
ncbi:MAG: M20/M25/M40 family metallo-hydrolase [Flavobacteriaceae bacterium]|nr:M20/M25/M40 family metallo-hydrolase [Flavobacteriaceae bacterium]